MLWAFNEKKGVTVAEYYVEKYKHLAPNEVEILEYQLKTDRRVD